MCPWNPLKELLKSCLCEFNNFPVLKSLTDISSSGHALKKFMWEELSCELGKPSIHFSEHPRPSKSTLILPQILLKILPDWSSGPTWHNSKAPWMPIIQEEMGPEVSLTVRSRE